MQDIPLWPFAVVALAALLVRVFYRRWWIWILAIAVYFIIAGGVAMFCHASFHDTTAWAFGAVILGIFTPDLFRGLTQLLRRHQTITALATVAVVLVAINNPQVLGLVVAIAILLFAYRFMIRGALGKRK